MRRDAERGFALITALVVIVLTLAVVALLAGSLHQRMAMVRQETRQLQLTALSDAGIALALARLSVDPSYGGAAATALGDGTVAVAVTPVATMTRLVTVHAAYGASRRSVEAEVRLSITTTPRIVSWRPLPGARNGL